MRQSYQKIKEILDKTDWQCSLIQPSPDHPSYQAEVSIKETMNGKPLHLRLILQGSDLVPGAFESSDCFDLLQMMLIFPIELDSITIDSARRLMCILNKICFFNGFSIDETTMHMFFRYSLVLTDKEDGSSTIPALIEAIAKQTTNFAPIIEQIGNGKQSYEEMIAQARSEMSDELASDLL